MSGVVEEGSGRTDGKAEIRWRHEWDEELLADFHRLLSGTYAESEVGDPLPSGLALTAFGVWVILALALLIAYAFGVPRDIALGMFAGLAIGYLGATTITWWLMRRAIRRHQLARVQRNLIDTVTMDAKGVRFESEDRVEHVRWKGVRRIFHAKTGLGFEFRDNRAFIAADKHLPPEIGRDGLSKRVRIWRSWS